MSTSKISGLCLEELELYNLGMSNVLYLSGARSIADMLERIGRLLARGRLVPVVAHRYPLSEAGAAQRAVVEDSFVGKIVLTIPSN